MLTYNKQTNIYSRYIHKSEIEATLEKMKAISSRVQYKSIDDFPEGKQLEDFHLIIDDATSLEKLFSEIPSFKLEQPVDGLRRTLFLAACGMSEDTEGIEYLINKGAEVNRNDLLGENALHMLVLNKNMAEKDKVKAAQMLIDKGFNVNKRDKSEFKFTPIMYAIVNANIINAPKVIRVLFGDSTKYRAACKYFSRTSSNQILNFWMNFNWFSYLCRQS